MRVHILAKELGVKSKAILEKCQAEGLPVKNHMSTLSAGLEATIREWFTQGPHVTTVETADEVDLEKVRVKRPARKRTAATRKKPESEADDVTEAPPEPAPAGPVEMPPAVAVAEAPAEMVEAVAEAPAVQPEAVAETPGVETPPEAPAEEKPAEVGPVEETPAEAPPAEHELPAEPPDVRPAGPQNVPAPAQLQGPQVIRVERPEPARRTLIRPRGGTGGPFRAPPPPPPPPTETTRPSRKGRGRGGGSGEDEEGSRHRVHPRRSGRSNDSVVGERLREWRDRDLIERQERLQAATGRGIHARRAAARRHEGGVAPSPAARGGKVVVSEPIVIKELCAAIGVPFNRVAPKLMEQGVFATINQTIDTTLA